MKFSEKMNGKSHMQESSSGTWLISPRSMKSTLDKIHISSIGFYLLFPLLVVFGKLFQIESIQGLQQELMSIGSLALGLWLIFDFFWPALPVSRFYITLHHLIAATIVGLGLFFEIYFPLAVGIILQEGYTFIFRKLIYAPTIELMADLARFTVSGILLAVYSHEVHWSLVLLWVFFILNNAYFFKSTHKKVFVQDSSTNLETGVLVKLQ